MSKRGVSVRPHVGRMFDMRAYMISENISSEIIQILDISYQANTLYSLIPKGSELVKHDQALYLPPCIPFNIIFKF